MAADQSLAGEIENCPLAGVGGSADSSAFSQAVAMVCSALPACGGITTADINRTFRDWFIASEANVSSDVSKVKKEMFDLNYIKIECAPDNVHLTTYEL